MVPTRRRRPATTRVGAGTGRAPAREETDALPARLAAVVQARCTRRRRPLLVGLSGLPGSGKTTLAARLARRLDALGLATVVVSLDDFYLGRRARATLAREVHPLLRTRGVAGTHELARLSALLDAIGAPGPWLPIGWPRYDRLADRRLPPSRWRVLTARPRVVLVEGWLVGVPAPERATLASPRNTLERRFDADGRWRAFVHRAMSGPYGDAWRKLDLLVALLAPDFATMRRWRRDAERRMAEARPGHASMDAAALQHFTALMQRWAEHALDTLPAAAHITVRLDARRGVRGIAMAEAASRTGASETHPTMRA